MVPRAREDIDAKALAEQWGVNRMGVVGMISQAKSNKKLYNDLIRAGYEDSEFPSWWYSPARDEGSSTESGNVELRPDSPVKPVLEAHPPETSIPRDQGAGRPTIQDSTLQDDAGRCWTMLDDAGRCWTMLDEALLRRA
jgi:hypothetical protein